MIGFWKSIASRLHHGERVFLALVVENTRHSPGTVGARMFVAEDGAAHGTIGGGVMERDVIERARSLFSKGGRQALIEIQTLHHTKRGEGEESGMICAGSQTNLYAVCRPEVDAATVTQVASLLEGGRSGTLTIAADGLRVVAEGPDLAQSPRRLLRSAEDWRYEEELLNRRRLAILGGGHCALALARVMGPLGYEMLACEGPKKPPTAGLEGCVRELVRVDDFHDAGGRVAYPELTWVVVMTSDFPSDVRALAGALARPFPFIGVMGSAAKIKEIRRQLAAESFSDEDLTRLTAPVGLPIGSNTPAEIAISVAAQILEQRSRIEREN